MATLISQFVTIDNLRLHYLEGGTGDPVLLLHGFPTSSFLWRNVGARIAESNRVIALDLPGFGQSDKPLDVSYSFRYFNKVLNQFLDTLNLPAVGLAVHDLGGPVGLYWACQNPTRVRQLALLNTLVYPEFSWAVIAFVIALKLPGIRWWLTSQHGLKASLKFGLSDKRHATEEAIRGIQAPFQTREDRLALIKAGSNLHRDGFKEIAQILPTFKVPVRVVYGEDDRILPDVAQTMRRVVQDLPQTQLTALPNCGHFLQEECSMEVGQLLAEFFAPKVP